MYFCVQVIAEDVQTSSILLHGHSTVLLRNTVVAINNLQHCLIYYATNDAKSLYVIHFLSTKSIRILILMLIPCLFNFKLLLANHNKIHTTIQHLNVQII